MKNSARISLLVFAVFCSAGLAACSNEKTVETPKGKVTVKETAKGVQIKSKDGSMSMEGDDKAGHIKVKGDNGKNVEMTYAREKLIEGFPRDVPIYASAKIKMSQLMGGQQAVATLSTKDSPEDVHKFYKVSLPKNGWSVEQEMTMGGMTMLQGKKSSNNLTVQISKQGDATDITIAMTMADKE